MTFLKPSIACHIKLMKLWSRMNATTRNFDDRYMLLCFSSNNIWCAARFGIICTIQKTWKTPMEECCFIKVTSTVLFECFSRFLNFTNGTKSRKTSPINLQKMIFLAYRSASFCFQSLLMTSEFYVRKREVCKHWNPSAIDLARLSLQSMRANYEKMSITSNSGFNSTFTPTLSVQT